MSWLLPVALAVLASSCFADRVLVLTENLGIRDTHSIYLGSIKDRGHQVLVRTADDASLALFKHGELIYEHLIILAPGVQAFGGSLSPKEISKFVDAGGNVLVAGSSKIGEAIRDLAVENGFEFDESNTAVIDHFNFDSSLDTGDHTTIVVGKDQLINAQLIVGDTTKIRPVLFKGVALIKDPSNHLALDIVTAASTSYSHIPGQIAENVAIAGKKTLLVAGLQARNNARIVFTGSVDMFSDAYFNAFATSANPARTAERGVASGNAALVSAITQWVLKENGVLRVKNVEHHRVGESQPPPREYTIMEDVEYAIEIEELKNGKWVPFLGKDVQLEFVRIDPFVRTTLQNKNGRLSSQFKIPDVYGVYKFSVDYRRVGYTHLLDVRQMSVRPLWHTQYERFIRSAYPYYASSFSMMAGVVLFSIAFLYHKDSAKVSVEAAKKKH